MFLSCHCGEEKICDLLIEESNVQLPELRAAEAANNGAHVLVDQVGDGSKVVDSVIEEVGNGLLQQLEGKAGKVVAGEESIGRENTAGDVSDVETRESVDLAGVATEFESVWVLGGD